LIICKHIVSLCAVLKVYLGGNNEFLTLWTTPVLDLTSIRAVVEGDGSVSEDDTIEHDSELQNCLCSKESVGATGSGGNPALDVEEPVKQLFPDDRPAGGIPANAGRSFHFPATTVA
jgi:hypothetical protein